MNDNPVSAMLVTFLLIIGLLFVPIINISIKADETSQGIIDNAVHEFIDNSRVTGSISVTDYEKMVSLINKAQPLCNIHIVYEKELYLLDGGNAPYRYFDTCSESQILDYMYPAAGDDQDFPMKKGDKISVTVYNTTPTYGMRLFSVISPRAFGSTTIYTTYGDFVLNNGY